MKTFIKILFFIPRLIWNIIWSIIKTLIILAAIIFAFLYFTNNHKTDLESTISEQWNKITTFFSNDFSLPDTMSKLSTDNYKHEAGSRWSQNSASVYIASTDKTIVKAYQTALVWLIGMQQEVSLLISFRIKHQQILQQRIILM